MADWKTISIHIILPLLSSGLIISAITSFYNDIYNKSNIKIEIIPNDIVDRFSTVKITNDGRLPAKDIVITVQTPESIIGYRIINTENTTVTYVAEKDPRLLKLYIPRFVNGDGSVVRVVILTAEKITDYSNYKVYATYNQGSIKVEALKEQLNINFVQLPYHLTEFSQKWSGFALLLSFALGVLIPLIVYTITSRLSQRLIAITKYTKIIDSIYNTLYQNKQECLKRLDEFHAEITQEFKKGNINDKKYDIYSKKISIYVSKLTK
jgi:hypothetical protein